MGEYSSGLGYRTGCYRYQACPKALGQYDAYTVDTSHQSLCADDLPRRFCKSPKHLITEIIDFISPTMVILGSRGQSQLKGVILGSFSNYLVTKSSVPVMVARKRLRKHTKYKRPAIRLANNLSNPTVKSLASAKID